MKSKITPPTYFILLLILQLILHLFYPIDKTVEYPYTLLGVSAILAGAILNLWTDQLFKKHQTTVKPHLQPTRLITHGPFAVSRHPMYLGMMLILCGVSVLTGSLSTLIIPISFILLMESLFIPIEEQNLEKNFGKQYHNYKSKVRRWL